MKNISYNFKNYLFKSKLESFYFLILLFSILWLKEISYLFYNTLESPDINKYFIYFDHFFNNQTTNKEHGLMYYYLQSLNYSIFYSDFQNFDLFIHKSIQQVNFYIFIFGLTGYFYLLRFFNFTLNVIYPTLLFINFFPPSISMRLVFKPEILAFALLPWIIYLLEKYLDSKDIKNLIFSIPLIVSIISIKGNVLVIISIYLFISYFRIFINVPKKSLIYLSLVVLISFITLSLENNSANGKTILDIQSGSAIEENYNFKAPRSIVYKTDMYGLISSPIKHNHADSFIGITLLEISGDYFDLYWDNNATEFFKNRKKIFTFVQSNEIKKPELDKTSSSVIIYQQRMTDVYLYETIGLLLSIFLFYFLIIEALKKSVFRKFLLASFLGMAVLLFHSITGVPKNNFDPLVGDTFKPLYYSFVLIFSFAILVAVLLSKKQRRIIYLGIYCSLIVFILGFPKSNEFEANLDMTQKIEASIYCPVEKLIYLDNNNFDSLNCNPDHPVVIANSGNGLYSNEIQLKPINLMFIFLNLISVLYVISNYKLPRKY
mgnify:FL=1|tara:strand:- start:3095 stop:4732 length:1638 start_codon:yes stop_codon:yes gene_type:complete